MGLIAFRLACACAVALTLYVAYWSVVQWFG